MREYRFRDDDAIEEAVLAIKQLLKEKMPPKKMYGEYAGAGFNEYHSEMLKMIEEL
jgi:hypothetical protein